MALTALLDLELAVPDPDVLAAFWTTHGMNPTAPGVLGTADRPTQLRLREGRYRHVAETHLACDDPADLAAIATRLDALGVHHERCDDRPAIVAHDPIGDHAVIVEVAEAPPLTPPASRRANRPGAHDRLDRRSTACVGAAPHAPRRVAHVVFGTPDVEASCAFYTALGYRVSDVVGGGLAVFLRCSSDHHNLLLSPAPVPCMNHYAVELDDVDAIGLAAAKILADRPECSVAGLGRHVVGANLFWYLLDPAGGMVELFADMDQIVDDDAWEATQRRDDWDPFTVAAWAPGAPAPDFWLPSDLDTIVAGRAAAGLEVA